MSLQSELENKLCKAVSQDDIGKFSELASPLKWGKPAWAACQLLLRDFGGDEKRLWLWASSLSADKNPYTRRYATWLLQKLWQKHRNRAGHILEALADDKDWNVREYAHDAWGELLKKHFHQVYPILEKWVEHPSPNLRRCVVKAARTAGNTKKKEWAEPLIQLIEPLLSDKTVYVRKNLIGADYCQECHGVRGSY